MKFKVGDYVRIADAIELELGLISEDFVGRIDAFLGEGQCSIWLDSLSMAKFTPEYIKCTVEEYINPDLVVVKLDQIEHCEQRETKKAYKTAKDKLEKLLEFYDSDEVVEREENLKPEWIEGFLQSKHYAELNEGQQAFAAEFLNWYIDAMHTMTGCAFYFFEDVAIEELLLAYFPNAFDVDAQLHEDAVLILSAFALYLEKDISYLYARDTERYDEFFAEMKTRFGENVGHPAYSLMKADGIDMKNVELVGEQILPYLTKISKLNFDIMREKLRPLQNSNPQESPHFSKKTVNPIKVTPPPLLSTDGLKGNDRVTVKYENGLLKQDVKYKQVKEDLEDGLCRLLRR